MRRRTNTRTHNLNNLCIINLVANTRKSTVPSKAKVLKERYNFTFKAYCIHLMKKTPQS